MKKLVLFFVLAMLLAACENDTDCRQQNSVELFPEPYGIEVVNASMSYAEFGEFGNGADGVLSMGTRGDIAIKLELSNTTDVIQTICRQHFVLDLDGKLNTTPTRLYNEQMRAKKSLYIQPNSNAVVVVYIDNAFGRMDSQWRDRDIDINSTYSLDIRICDKYLFGCDIYAHHDEKDGWKKR